MESLKIVRIDAQTNHPELIEQGIQEITLIGVFDEEFDHETVTRSFASGGYYCITNHSIKRESWAYRDLVAITLRGGGEFLIEPLLEAKTPTYVIPINGTVIY